jgi:ABC-2 type transport system permease protein
MPEPRARPEPSYLGKITLVGWREFRHTALTKGFIFGAVVMPILMLGVFALVPMMLTKETPPLVGEIAIADPSGAILPRTRAILERDSNPVELANELADDLASRAATPMGAAGTAAVLDDLSPAQVEVTWRDERDLAQVDGLKAEVRNGGLLAAAVVREEALDTTREPVAIEYYIPSSLSPKHVRQIARALRKAIEEERIVRSGVDRGLLARLAPPPEPTTTRISPEGSEAEENTELRMIVPMAFMMLLWICVFTSANYLLTTTIEEKSNKVMEVLLAAVSPMQLLAGKILGYSAVSLVTLVMYGGAGLAGLSAAAMLDLVPISHLVYLGLFFVMAYVMVASMMAAVGSAVSDLREAQSLVGPVMILLVIPLMLWMPIIQNPNGVLATVASFVPPAIPFVMILRLTAATEPIPMWQTVVSVVWGFGAAFGMLWLAARIFRVGVLMQGKPPTPRELVRWAFVR